MENYIYGLLAIAAMVAPVAYLIISKKSRETAFFKRFTDLAGEKNIHIDQSEVWSINYAIGLDGGAGKLFYYKKLKEGETTLVIDLGDVDKCRVATKSRTMKTKGGSNSVIDHIDLALSISGPQKTEKMIEIFNGQESLSLRGEPLIAEKWCGIVNASLKKKKAAIH